MSKPGDIAATLRQVRTDYDALGPATRALLERAYPPRTNRTPPAEASPDHE